MSRPRLHILRQIRLQLKSGFLKTEPAGYEILKKFPPIARPVDQFHRMKTSNVPYASLYRKLMEQDPLFQSEKVYGAYAGLEPLSLVLAKRQYTYMSEGLSEEAAFKKAMELVNDKENEGYVEMKRVLEKIKRYGGTKNLVKDLGVAKSLAQWQERTQHVPYDEMSLAEQGEIDFFVQTKILGWNEVERERRMREPVFVQRFQDLIDTLFPMSGAKKAERFEKFKENVKSQLFTMFSLDAAHMNTTKPFYLEDYVTYLQKLRSEPDLRQWQVKDREEFSRWIVDTLAYGAELMKKEAGDMQEYLDALREQFFPLVRLPFLAQQMKIPSVQQMKETLFSHEIGYKKEEDKTFVKRFYKLPRLLFPLEFLALEIVQTPDTLKAVLNDSSALRAVVEKAGLPEAKGPELQQLLEQYRIYADSQPQSKSKESSLNSSEFSILDEILNDQGAGEKEDASGSASSLSTSTPSSVPAVPGAVYGSPEWHSLISKYNITMPRTELEKEQASFYDQGLVYSLEDVSTDEEAEDFADSLMQSKIIIQARLQREYDLKESARRKKDWEQRGVWGKEEFYTPLPAGEKK